MQTFPLAERWSYLRRFGSHCLAYATLQAGMEYFDLPGVGYLAYSQYCGTRFALAEPVCAAGDQVTLLRAALAEHGETCFLQVKGPFAEVLRRHEFYVTAMGVEVVLDLDSYSLSGPSKQNIRTARNKIERSRAVVREMPLAQARRDDLERISADWLREKANRRELRFMTRPAVYADEAGVRKFFLTDAQGTITGFVFFDPMYEQDRLVGYVSDVNRALDGTPKGYDYAITAQAIQVFKAEGVQRLSLGLCPLAGRVQPGHAGQNPLTAVAASCLTGCLNSAVKRIRGTPIYSFRGLYEHKAEYRGREEPVFFCSRSHWQLGEIMGLLNVCHVL